MLKNIVLVHGAFADGSSWQTVIEKLQASGYQVTAVQNPLTSLADDVAATKRILDQQDGDVLLVGHSWGGVVISEAGNHPKVKRLVYVSAMVPDSGESAADMLVRLNAPMEGLQPDEHGLVSLPNWQAYKQLMANDLPDATVKRLFATQQSIAAAAFTDKISQAAWKNKPSDYIITENDNALPPAVQHQLAEQIQANRHILQSSHLSLLSQPQAVADYLQQAAEK